MEGEANKKEDSELVSEKRMEETLLTFRTDGRPEPLITVKDNAVKVKTFKVSMSRKQRVLMFIDIWTIAWVAGLIVYFVMSESLSKYVWIVAPIGVLTLLCAIGKTIVDFLNWLYATNAMIEQMGSWYVDDVIGIVNDFISAGTKFAAEEVKKAIGGEQASETKDGAAEA